MARASLSIRIAWMHMAFIGEPMSYSSVLPPLITRRPGSCRKRRLPWIRIMGALTAVLAWTHFHDWTFGWLPGKPKESYQKALDLAYKAVALDPSDGLARGTLAYHPALSAANIDEAAAEFEEGLKANPNDADLIVFSAEFYIDVGRPEEAIRRVKEAMRLNPYYPNWYLCGLGWAQYQAHDYQGAVETLKKMSPMGEARRHLAASLAQLGRMEEARVEAEKYLKDNPSFSATYAASTSPSSTKRIDSTPWRASSRPAFRGEIDGMRVGSLRFRKNKRKVGPFYPSGSILFDTPVAPAHVAS